MINDQQEIENLMSLSDLHAGVYRRNTGYELILEVVAR